MRGGGHAAYAILAAVLCAAAPGARADTLIVGNKGEDTVSFIDLDTGRERARVRTEKAPHEVAVSPDRRRAAVVAYGGSTIDVFDVATATLVRRIDLAPGQAPHGIAWLRNGRIVATAERSASLVIADPRSGSVRSVAIGQVAPHMLAVSPDQRRAYVANIGSGSISVIDLRRARKLSDISVGGRPEGIAITRDGRHLWVGDNAAPQVHIVEIASGRTVQTLPADPVAIRVAISPDGRTAITSAIGAGTLNLFDVATRRALRTISVSGTRDAMQVTAVFSPDGRRVYAAETARNAVAEVDLASGQVLRRITAGKGSDGIGIAR